jgi:acid phosphatase
MSNTNPSQTYPTSSVTPQSHVPFDVEDYPVAPSGLTLEQVHLFIRHGTRSYIFNIYFFVSMNVLFVAGERTPVRVRMSEPPASIPAYWALCHEGRRFQAAVASLSGGDTLNVRRVVEREDGTHRDGEW